MTSLQMWVGRVVFAGSTSQYSWICHNLELFPTWELVGDCQSMLCWINRNPVNRFASVATKRSDGI